jgi:hypothetical protein
VQLIAQRKSVLKKKKMGAKSDREHPCDLHGIDTSMQLSYFPVSIWAGKRDSWLPECLL